MKTIIWFLGRFIRLFHRTIAAILALILLVMPIFLTVLACAHLGIRGFLLAAIVVVTVVVEFFWALNIGIWWDEHFSESSRVVTFPRRH